MLAFRNVKIHNRRFRMKAILVNEDKSLIWGDVPMAVCGDEECLIKIEAAALNRADLMQREGDYPPPAGCPEWMGLEISGEIVEIGCKSKKKSTWKLGDKVCALLGGGGYAEYVSVKYDMLMPVPKNCSMVEAAAIPEAFATAYVQKTLTDTDFIDEDIADSEREMDLLTEMIRQTVMQNASASVTEDEYRRRYNDLTDRFRTEEEKHKRLTERRKRMVAESIAIGGMLSQLTKLEAPPIEFDEKLWHAVVDRVTVYNDDRLVYSLKDGTEITVML